VKRILKLLYPGLGIKRWLLLLMTGFVIVLGASLALIIGLSGLRGLAGRVLAFFLSLSGGQWVLLVAILFLGMAVIIVAWLGFLRSLLGGVVPRNEKMVDVLYQSR